MEHLPSSIEAYLTDAGFSGTELLILNKLLSEDALTLREMAAKTGKSTGVLDQAMKKLLKKGIITRETINEVPKYRLHSLESVADWVRKDGEQKQIMLARRFENFEAFIATLKKGKSRPEMEYFEGEEGIKRAYMQLLTRGRLFLRYGPTLYTAEDDPLRDFRIQYFRERNQRGIFSREITHDTVLGRRYRSRDSFEYRQTLLVDRQSYPFTFEKIIVGDTVACFQLEDKQACFIRYLELAEDERAFFERLWQKKLQNERDENEAANARAKGDALPLIEGKLVPVRTRVLSSIRDFFLGRRGLIGLSACVLLSSGLTFLVYSLMANANLQRIREQVKSVAATGALQFDAKDLDQLRTKADAQKPEYVKVIGQLNAIRQQNPDLTYAYILRPLQQENEFEYVADADSIDLNAVFDLNKDGKIDAKDDMIAPGRKYTATDAVYSESIQNKLAASHGPYTDEWGTLISGAAPIYDKNGNLNALLGIDSTPKDIYAGLDFGTMMAFFIGLLLLFIVIWLGAIDRFVLKEICTYMKEHKTIATQLLHFFFSKKGFLATVLCAALAAGITYGIYYNNASLNLKRIQDKVLSIAATGALQFDAKDLDQLHTPADITKPEYAKVIYLLNAIRKQNQGVKYMYIMRPTAKDGIWEFVADADSLDPYAKKDLNGDGKVDDADHLSPPGETYDAKQFSTDIYQQSLIRPSVSAPSNDQWGNIISAWAPIKDESGTTVAILGVDKFASDVNNLTQKSFTPLYYFFGLFLLFIVMRLAAFNRSLLKEIGDVIKIRKVMIVTGSAAVVSLIMTFALYQYTQHLTLNRMKDKVLAIASTAASQFDPNDINALQVKEDWQKPEWAKVGNQLEKIRKENTYVFYAYIIRKTKKDPTKMEFAGDADSINSFANIDNDPTNDVDMNRDGKIDGSPTGGDYQAWPSQPYPTVPPDAFDAYDGPTTTRKFYEDQWGKFITGYAPIKDQTGNVAAILAIDIAATRQNNLTKEVFAPIYAFIIFFILFILFRIPGFNTSLLHQLLRPFRTRLALLIMLFIITLIVGTIFWLYQYTLHIMKEEIGTRLMSIAATAAPEFSADDLNQIHIAADMKKDAYQRVFKKLNEIRKHNEDIKYAYVWRPTWNSGIWEFIADADSNYFIPFEGAIDYNSDSQMDKADENVYPGETYDLANYSTSIANSLLKQPTFDEQLTPDQWGSWLSGFAPIRDANGNTVAVLGVDMDVTQINNISINRLNFVK